MLKRFSLKKKVILLTGAAGQFGRGLVADLAEAGATLVVASRDLESCEWVAAQEQDKGWSVSAEQYDQGDRDSIEALCDRLLERYGRIDGVVNNALGSAMQADVPDEWDASLRVNATGVYLMHHYFGEAMATQGEGSIVNVASIYGMVGPKLSIYDGSGVATRVPDYYFHKAGMVSLTRYYAAHFGERGVRVNSVSPGALFDHQPPAFVEKYTKETFLGRMADRHDLSGPVVFLLSDAARYVTGVNLPVDGGYTAH